MPYGNPFFSELFLKQYGLYNLSKHYEIGTANNYPLNTYTSTVKLPLIFPRVDAFLCSKETFSWAVELYEVEGEGTETDLVSKGIGVFAVKGLGIPSPNSRTITIKDNMERGLDYTENLFPLGVSYYKTNDDTPYRLNGEREREIEITGDGYDFPGIEPFDFYKGNNIPHGQLLDMAIYIYD